MGRKFDLKLNTGERPIANKYREGKMKRTLKRELKVLEIAEREAFGVYILLGSQISPKGVAVPVYQGGLQVPWCVGAGGYLWMHSGYQEASID